MASGEIYLLAKAIHVLAAILFVGNICVTAVWKLLADRTRDPRVVRFAQRGVILTDWWFTGPSAALLLVSGLVATLVGALPVAGSLWWLSGFALFMASGLVWGARLIPLQAAQARALRSCSEDEIPDGYWPLCRSWTRAGIAANVFPIVAIFLMVLKPG